MTCDAWVPEYPEGLLLDSELSEKGGTLWCGNCLPGDQDPDCKKHGPAAASGVTETNGERPE